MIFTSEGVQCLTGKRNWTGPNRIHHPKPNGSRSIWVLGQKGSPVKYVTFEGVQHGLRNARNIKRALDSELYIQKS